MNDSNSCLLNKGFYLVQSLGFSYILNRHSHSYLKCILVENHTLKLP